jgi:C-terminal processing protease CtpA/Prc
MSTVAENLGLEYGASPGYACPVVTRVDDKGPAEEAGVELGDEIVAVDGMSMEEGDVLSLLSTSPGEKVKLLLRQGGGCDMVRNSDPESLTF